MIEKRQFVYRLIDERANVLYVGQHTGIHPAVRIDQHQDKPWWPEVAGWDSEVITGDLNAAENDLIRFWSGYHNKETRVFRNRLETMPTPELLFAAGQSAGEYRHDPKYCHAGRLKLIRTLLWRRDKTPVPVGDPWSGTPKDFSPDWDFADFPILSTAGFIPTMGCFQPAGFKVAHPECGFEIDHHPLVILPDRGAYFTWERCVENAAIEGGISWNISYWNPPAPS